MKSIFKGIKGQKKLIVRTLAIGGAVLGAVMLAKTASKRSDDLEIYDFMNQHSEEEQSEEATE